MNLEKHIDALVTAYKSTYKKIDEWQNAKTTEGEAVKQRSYKLTREAASEENAEFHRKYQERFAAILEMHKAEVEKVKEAYYQEVDEFYMAKGTDIDAADKLLLDSGIMTTEEFERLAIKYAENVTMLRIMKKYLSNYEALETDIQRIFLCAIKDGEKEKSVFLALMQYLDAPIGMAKHGYTSRDIILNTMLNADDYAKNAKIDLIKAKLYLTKEDKNTIRTREAKVK